jgi:hypothetical protein
LGLLCLPVATIGSIGLSLHGGRTLAGVVVVMCFVAVCIVSLTGAIRGFRRRRDTDPDLAVLRLSAATVGPGKKSSLVIGESEIRIYAPEIFSREWVIPRQEVSWSRSIAEKGDVVPAVVPRMLPLVTHAQFRLNLVMFFAKPQRIPPIERAISSVPFTVEESQQGVWADGIVLSVESSKKARLALTTFGVRDFASLPEAARQIYGSLESPMLEPSEMQVAADVQGDEGLSEVGV